jgi:hypothetical protein
MHSSPVAFENRKSASIMIKKKGIEVTINIRRAFLVDCRTLIVL